MHVSVNNSVTEQTLVDLVTGGLRTQSLCLICLPHTLQHPHWLPQTCLSQITKSVTCPDWCRGVKIESLETLTAQNNQGRLVFITRKCSTGGQERPYWLWFFLLITAGQILDGCLTLKKSHTSCWLKLPNSIWSVHTRTEEISTKPGAPSSS